MRQGVRDRRRTPWAATAEPWAVRTSATLWAGSSRCSDRKPRFTRKTTDSSERRALGGGALQRDVEPTGVEAVAHQEVRPVPPVPVEGQHGLRGHPGVSGDGQGHRDLLGGNTPLSEDLHLAGGLAVVDGHGPQVRGILLPRRAEGQDQGEEGRPPPPAPGPRLTPDRSPPRSVGSSPGPTSAVRRRRRSPSPGRRGAARSARPSPRRCAPLRRWAGGSLRGSR